MNKCDRYNMGECMSQLQFGEQTAMWLSNKFNSTKLCINARVSRVHYPSIAVDI